MVDLCQGNSTSGFRWSLLIQYIFSTEEQQNIMLEQRCFLPAYFVQRGIPSHKSLPAVWSRTAWPPVCCFSDYWAKDETPLFYRKDAYALNNQRIFSLGIKTAHQIALRWFATRKSAFLRINMSPKLSRALSSLSRGSWFHRAQNQSRNSRCLSQSKEIREVGLNGSSLSLRSCHFRDNIHSFSSGLNVQHNHSGFQ